MKENNIIQIKSFDFAVLIVTICRKIMKEQNEYILTKQLFRCGTSIGANIEEAIGGQSTKDFFLKLTIAYKEARESVYWIRLMHDTKILQIEDFQVLLSKSQEICRIIGSIQKTLKQQS